MGGLSHAALAVTLQLQVRGGAIRGGGGDTGERGGQGEQVGLCLCVCVGGV